jgi:hypothetical protein
MSEKENLNRLADVRQRRLDFVARKKAETQSAPEFESLSQKRRQEKAMVVNKLPKGHPAAQQARAKNAGNDELTAR